MTNAADIRLLVFRVGTLVCAAEVDRVREILPRLAATRIPGAHPAVAGLVNIRGMLVTVVEGWRVLSQPAPERPAQAAVSGNAGSDVSAPQTVAAGQNDGSTILLEVGRGNGATGGGDVDAGGAAATSGRLVGLTVDEVMDLLVMSAGSLEPRQALPGLDPILVRAVGRRARTEGGDGGLVVVLDTDALLAPILS